MTSSYCEFLDTEDEAIDHCREVNRGMVSTDPNCRCIIDGPGPGWDDTPTCAYAVVDQETAREILDYEETRIPYLIVT